MTISVQEETHNPTVTVVIPVYNSTQYIVQTLDSIKAQTFNDYEVIVVNDGSNDREELEQILRDHPLPVVYVSQENKGVSAARNAAIKLGRGEFYAQVDADDQWMPDYLDVQLEVLKRNPEVVLVYPNATIIGDASAEEVEFMKICPSAGEVNFETLVLQQCVVMTSVTARMSTIREAGMFDEDLRSCEDFDLWLRVAKNGGRITYHRQPLVWYRRHAGSLSSDRVWMTRNLLTVLKKCARTLSLTEAEQQALNQEINRNQSHLRLFEGKRALSTNGGKAALACFQEANQHLRSTKLSLVIFLLRYMPQVVTTAFSVRERLLARLTSNELRGIDQPRVS